MNDLIKKYRGQIYIISILCIMPFLLYQLAFKRTYSAWMQLKSEKQRIIMIKKHNLDAPSDLNLNLNLNRININLSQFLFEVSKLNECVIESYIPNAIKMEHDDIKSPTIYVSEVTVAGRYHNLISILFQLESKSSNWEIGSAEFRMSRSKIDPKEHYLQLLLIIKYVVI